MLRQTVALAEFPTRPLHFLAVVAQRGRPQGPGFVHAPQPCGVGFGAASEQAPRARVPALVDAAAGLLAHVLWRALVLVFGQRGCGFWRCGGDLLVGLVG